MFAVGIATVVLPNLSRQYVKGQQEYSLTLDWALRLVLVIAIPSTLGLILLAQPILFTLFHYGETDVFDITMSTWSMCAYAFGLTAFMLIKILVSGFFSRQDTRTPVRIGIIAMVSNMLMNVVFLVPAYYLWNVGHAGLALATSVAAYLNAALLYVHLRKQGVYTPSNAMWLFFIWRVMAASVAMVTTLLWLKLSLPEFLTLAWHERVFHLFLIIAGAKVVFIGTLWALGMRVKHFKVQEP